MSLAEASRLNYRKMEASESPMTDPGASRNVQGVTQSPSPSPPSASSDLSSAPESIILTPMSIQSQSRLLKTPSEILHRVLCSSGADDPASIAHAALTCSQLRNFIYENPDSALWRDIYLRRFDDPRLAGAFTDPREPKDWKKQVQDREFVSRILMWDSAFINDVIPHLDLIVSTLLEMYLDLPASSDPAPPGGSSSSAKDDPKNAIALACMIRSEAFRHLYFHHSTTETKPLLRPLREQPGNPNRRTQKRAVNSDLMRLHVLLAPDFDGRDEVVRQHRGWLREMVYSAINYTEDNDWGPFHPDGTVDWTLVDAIGSVMMGNAKDVLAMGEEGWRQALAPISYGIEPTRGWGFNDLTRPSGGVWDWAGVEGIWCGSYAFLDYTDWITLNEPRLIQLRRSLNSLDLSRYNEAVGDLMRLDVVIDTEDYKPPPMAPVETTLPTSSLLPPIRFHGSSAQQNGLITYPSNSPASFVRGVVQLTADNPPQVRWTLVIRYGGEDRWRLECVQVGGRGSKRGFFGVWTDALKEEHSPNGPVWYWKP